MDPRIRLLAAMAATLTLAACGGGDGYDPPAPAPAPAPAPPPPAMVGDVPVSATLSTTAWVQFARGLAPRDDAEPLNVRDVFPPISESTEPLPFA